MQEYFLVACTLRDIVRRFEQNHTSYREFSAKVAIQLNDTHPALTVAELMRILIDEKNLEWEEAWDDHAGDFGLHQSHVVAGGAGEVAGSAPGARASAAPADHL